jgi:hypothetical protein
MACASRLVANNLCKNQFKSEVWAFFLVIANCALWLVADQA